ncbi:hypothetical protein HanIR_Chr01g0012951 [Helianthus annuus]|nr:hypothetical protein HanIR_Chr01g0012951 [Helianthus annuus]
MGFLSKVFNEATYLIQKYQGEIMRITRCTLFPLAMVLSHRVFLARFLMRQHQAYYVDNQWGVL